jgi:hypothetical protein
MYGCCPFDTVAKITRALILIERVEDSPPTTSSTKEQYAIEKDHK